MYLLQANDRNAVVGQPAFGIQKAGSDKKSEIFVDYAMGSPLQATIQGGIPDLMITVDKSVQGMTLVVNVDIKNR